MHEWSNICGDILSGKTQTIYKLLREFLRNQKVQVCGFFQPSREEGDSHVRNGYDLAMIRENDVIYKIFAIKNVNAPPNTMPWVFNQELFDAAVNQANTFRFDGRPIVLLLDEMGQLEVHGKGHSKAVDCWLNRLIKEKKVFVIFTTAERRMDLARNIFNSAGFTESSLKIKVPTTDEEIKNFSQQIIDKLTN